MDVEAGLDAPAAADELFVWVEDLGRYPQWLDIVPRAEPAPAHEADEGPAWFVTLRGRIGPLSRSKRLRMVRTQHDRPHEVTFERREHDGQQHSLWRLRAVVDQEVGHSRLTMHLHYGGGLWDAVVERMLQSEIDRSRERLLALLPSR